MSRPSPSPQTAAGMPPAPQLSGNSLPMQALRAQIGRIARCGAPVAIRGESGTGKELAARAIHAQGARASFPFIAVNCGAIPEALMEAEFFGCRPGAYTGALHERQGLFQAAHGGSLLLDEVDDLPLSMQVKLLRVLQERRVRKLGGSTDEAVDVRILCASQHGLGRGVAAGTFRQDLFYRLNVIELALPPLRERRGDLQVLCEVILARLSPRRAVSLAPPVLAALAAYAFPGNVRELENVLERALAFADGGVIALEGLALPSAAGSMPSRAPPALPERQLCLPGMAAYGVPPVLPLDMYLRQAERDMILLALVQARYHRARAARQLGLSVRQLRYRMQKLTIQEALFDERMDDR
ncbi:sigma 54-interacting transcriptional regulator [Janthinobacterium lividum]|uniref:sigma 54-interacting transcriptional regulator n=1 Tax=Janthinobacterium lividum TaxID=29581 RepID=UPI000875796A|nr:sigma-54 dependent transcriptional regulator [Janthinobacterium lividum]MCC7713668.1 sigma-54-dependent Fis family transcriptional regulator [Janthinobacterium lividum]OEZ57816.1 nitrogen fixation protein VnfA [Janthinobacterium lividum]WQE28382.1 sigma-54 dependent transcriptional regulator [Janthinobacterium lividum]STQ99323.1 Transcriptional regulatory protein ZraR [Janthinobacterium lividum]